MHRRLLAAGALALATLLGGCYAYYPGYGYYGGGYTAATTAGRTMVAAGLSLITVVGATGTATTGAGTTTIGVSGHNPARSSR